VQLLGLFDVNIEITMETTVRKYVVQCSSCLYADHGNQTILSIDMFNHRAFLIQRLAECDVTQPTIPWLMLKNAPMVYVTLHSSFKLVSDYKNKLRTGKWLS